MQAARKIVETHHGGGTAMHASTRSKDDWLCKSCQGPDGTAFRNFGSRTECKKCRVHKGAVFGKKADVVQPRATPTLAERQVKQQREHETHAKTIKKKDDELAALRAEIRKRDAQTGGAATSGGAATAGSPTDNATDLDLELTTAQQSLDAVARLETVAKAVCFPGEGQWEAKVNELKTKLEECKARKRGLLSLPEQLKRAEVYEDRMAKKTAAMGKKIEDMAKAMLELQAETAACHAETQLAQEEYKAATEQRANIAGLLAAQVLHDAQRPRSGAAGGGGAAQAAAASVEATVAGLLQQVAELQRQLAQGNELFQATEELQAMVVDVDDMFSDGDSVAPTEPGEDREATRAKRVQTKAERADKRRKVGDGIKRLHGVASKFRSHGLVG